MMGEYISRGGENFPTYYKTPIPDGSYRQGWNDCLRAIYQLPAADVAPVVRCRECKGWMDTRDSDLGICVLTKRVVTRRDYCSSGERKDGADMRTGYKP